jgi:hypothetical protein
MTEQSSSNVAEVSARSLRVLVRHEGKLRRFCKFVSTKRDGSLYVIPYAANGQYLFGGHEFGESERSTGFDMSGQLASDDPSILPHLSLHESGQVHAHCGAEKAGPLLVPPLADWRGEHAVSVIATRFSGLAPFAGEPSGSPAKPDLVLTAADGLESGRIALFLNGEKPSFEGECLMTIKFVRPTLDAPLYVGLEHISQDPLGDPGDEGVLVVGGWHPIEALTQAAAPFLFVRGK